MADQTVFAISDVEISSSPNQNNDTQLFLTGPGQPGGTNILFGFDVSSLEGKMWDSVVLKLVYHSSHTASGGPHYLARVLKSVVYTEATGPIYSTGNNWDSENSHPGTNFAEDATDNDHTTRVDQTDAIVLGISHAFPEEFVSTDITNMVRDGVLAGGTLDLLFYVPSTSGILAWKSIEFTGAREQDPKLFFTNVRDQEDTFSSNLTGTAANIAVPSATVLSKSGRPPIAGADRQVSASILHDGVEPMTILAITLKGQFGADN